ncbi:vWA domain-containing protein [Saccharospirillum salsuginis]|uniref:VWFA domain-containing protein n=1 Tax=Saccharospirillum salsuginis TaxID=418750 RepID=A0A918KHJ3_9GAMM|nr:vWA domain-containing protein [Saccharospirillum salsuginis]GGX61120.1 hypothetical protein GCM10007392_31440 [Saccharospirillum salsuginis]
MPRPLARPGFSYRQLLWLVFGGLLALTLRAETPPPAATDIRILVDISGSMVETDPQNRRTPALNLLVDSLPEGSRAGVWSFGRFVNLLVDHDTVDADWRATARSRLRDLRPIAQRTNLGAALDDAAYDFGYSTYEPPTDVILITDGRVDIAPNEGVNRIERDRILNTVIPRFAQAGARIHTLALTDAADAGLLEQMSLRTDGTFERVESANDIRDFILSVLSRVRPGNELPLSDSGFEVDSQVSEVSALVLHDSGQIGLRSPSGQTTDALNPDRQQWRVGDGYTLVTVNAPEEGRWEIEGAVESGSRITVVSDLNLRWQQPEGAVVVRAQPLLIELRAVDQDGQPVDAALTGIMDPSLSIQGQTVPLIRWQGDTLRAQVPNRYDEGPLDLEVRVDAGTFQRLVRRTIQNRPALSSEVLVDGQGYQWRLYPSHRNLNVEGNSLEADISGPDGSQTRAFQRHPSGYFYTNLAADQPDGDYRLTAEGRLTINDRPLTNLGVAPVTLSLPIRAGQARIMDLDAAPMPEEPETTSEEEQQAEMSEPYVKEPMPEFEEITAQITAAEPSEPAPEQDWQETPAVEDDSPDWVTYLLYSLPGLIILIGFFVGYRLLEKRGKTPESGETTESGTDAKGQALEEEELQDIEDLDLAAGVTADSDDGGDWGSGEESREAPLVDEVVDEEAPPPPDNTEAPRADMEDSLDTSLLDQEDWGELDSTGDENDPDDDLFDISNIDDSLSDLEDLSLDEDEDPFASLLDEDEEDSETEKDKKE